MVVYNSMLVMDFVLMIIYHIQQPRESIRLSRPIPWGYAVLSMGYIVFWAAMRSGYMDTRAYITMFEYANTGADSAIQAFERGGKAPGWAVLEIVFKTIISSDFHWWLATIAIFSGIPIMITLRNRSVDYLFSIFLFIASGSYIWMFNGIRQFLVASVLFGFYYLLLQNKKLVFALIVLCCSYVHTSALILLPAIFLVDYKPFGKMMLFVVLITLTSAAFVGFLIDTLDVMLQDSEYHDNLSQFAEDDGAHPLRVLFQSVPAMLAFIKRKKLSAMNNNLINICVNMSTLCAGLYFIAMFTSGIMIGRLPIYFELYNLILIPFLLNFVYSSEKRLLYFCFYVFYLIFYTVSSNNVYYVSDILGNYF